MYGGRKMLSWQENKDRAVGYARESMMNHVRDGDFAELDVICVVDDLVLDYERGRR